MKKLKRTLITSISMMLVCLVSVSVTLAYLYTKTDTVVNTFTVGNVTITLDELDVDKDSNTSDNKEYTVDGVPTIRDTANAYNLISAKTYDKDPTVHVGDTSEDAWLFVQIQIGENLNEALLKDDPAKENDGSIADQLAANGWVPVSGSSTVYAYNAIVHAGEDKVVFKTITISADTDSDTLDAIADNDETIKITAYAVQSYGLDSVNDAWSTLSSKYAELNT